MLRSIPGGADVELVVPYDAAADVDETRWSIAAVCRIGRGEGARRLHDRGAGRNDQMGNRGVRGEGRASRVGHLDVDDVAPASRPCAKNCTAFSFRATAKQQMGGGPTSKAVGGSGCRKCAFRDSGRPPGAVPATARTTQPKSLSYHFANF